MDNTQLKKELLAACIKNTEARIHNFQSAIDSAKESSMSEMKSSAGDKHNTSQAMLHLEQEKNGQQLNIAQNAMQILKSINSDKTSTKVESGSIVFTNSANYFIAISVGKLLVNDTNFYVISPVSPIGKAMLGKTEGEIIEFNNQKISITNIF